MASARTTEVELTRYPQPEGSVEIETPRDEITDDINQGFSLPPTDGGKHAWLMLFACFMLEGLIWGTEIWVRSHLLY